MVSSKSHYATFSTDSTLPAASPNASSPANSSTCTLTGNGRDYFSTYTNIKCNKAESPTINTATTSGSTDYTNPPSTADYSSNTTVTTLPGLTTPTLTNEKELDLCYTYTFTRTESSYAPAEFNYSTPPGQSKSLYRRIKNFFKAFHIIRHWPKYERKLERKLHYLREDVAYWRGEVEERERQQMERLERQKQLLEEKRKREAQIWGVEGGLRGCAPDVKVGMMGNEMASMVGACY
ncbi:hypothetical protein BJ508DRAFT_360937 [Ascobolus immersus RN42]|uniref:Uncharacterized protein n=1 Tax=Ascobolus immersus RN42 TaxID=1160509 RepID=A0A3N4I9H2_ASCIM|nr:hypothetical protein BJ508DRAFT_360937 [Ascobolus immersus RN42]